METNTVYIKLEEYNELRDFKKNIVDNKSYQIVEGTGGRLKLITESKVVEGIIRVNKELSDTIKDLLDKIKNLEHPVKKEVTLEDIKKMSYWEFRKWKKSNL